MKTGVGGLFVKYVSWERGRKVVRFSRQSRNDCKEKEHRTTDEAGGFQHQDNEDNEGETKELGLNWKFGIENFSFVIRDQP